MRLYHVYKHTNTINNKAYIGITSKSIELRFQQHIKFSLKNKNTNRPFHLALRKYPSEVWHTECLAIVETKKEACELEKKFIESHNTHYSMGGYNVTIGGDGFIGGSHTSAAKLKASNALRDKPKTYDNGRKGKKLSDEHKSKLVNKSKYISISEEQFKYIKENQDKMSYAEIARQLNTDIKTIKRWLSRAEFKRKKSRPLKRRKLSYEQYEFLISHRKTMTIKEIAKHLNVNYSLLKKWVNKPWEYD